MTATLNEIQDAPGGLPLVGHLLALSRNLPGTLRAAAARGTLQRIRNPLSQDIYLWPSTDSLKLLSRRDVSASESAEIGSVIVGHTSMLSSDGADHRRRRAASSAPFTPKGLSITGVSDIISEVVTTRVERLLHEGSFQLLHETQALSLEILFRVLGVPGDEIDAWVRHYTVMIRSVLTPSWNVPGFPYRRALAARAWVDERLRTYVEAARRDPEATGLVAELLRGRDEDDAGLSEEELFDNLRLMVLAGHETTASVMAWMVAYLVREPDHCTRLCREANQTEGLPRTASEVRAYPFAEAFFRECLRLHPPALIATRRTLQPMEVADTQLPAGTLIGVPLWLFARDPETFPDPDRFDPDRWIREQRSLSPLETSAFGGGPHFCLGYHMAWVESVQFIVCLVRAMDQAGVRPQMRRMPRESYLPLLRPVARDTRCRFVTR